MDVRAPAVYAQVVRRAQSMAAGDDRRGRAALAQFQGAVAILDRARFARTLAAAEVESLLTSLAAVPLTGERASGRRRGLDRGTSAPGLLPGPGRRSPLRFRRGNRSRRHGRRPALADRHAAVRMGRPLVSRFSGGRGTASAPGRPRAAGRTHPRRGARPFRAPCAAWEKARVLSVSPVCARPRDGSTLRPSRRKRRAPSRRPISWRPTGCRPSSKWRTTSWRTSSRRWPTPRTSARRRERPWQVRTSPSATSSGRRPGRCPRRSWARARGASVAPSSPWTWPWPGCRCDASRATCPRARRASILAPA